MNKLFMGILLTCAVIFTLTICMSIWSINLATEGRPHKCRWSECPYKWVAYGARDSAVCAYIGSDERYSDAWCIDMEHFKHPEMNYDQLDSLLFTPKSK